MSIKILVSSLANSGKTTLLQSLKDVLVIAIDGKNYPFPQPHVNIKGFNTINEFTAVINDKISAYNDKFGEFPKTIAIDSVSRVFETAANSCSKRFNGFTVFSELNKEIAEFNSYIENTLIANGVNVVLVSHALYDPDTARYALVAQGNFAKTGGFLSVVDQAIFLEVKGDKRIVHHRNAKMASRTTLTEEELPNSQPVSEYNLQEHIDMLSAKKDEVADFIL